MIHKGCSIIVKHFKKYLVIEIGSKTKTTKQNWLKIKDKKNNDINQNDNNSNYKTIKG